MGFAFFFFLRARRRWNGDIDFLHGSERRERLVELFGVADHQYRELIAMDILCRYAIDVGGGHFLDFRGKLVEPVRGISVEFVGEALGENLVGRVEAEDESVQDGVFRLLEFLRR